MDSFSPAPLVPDGAAGVQCWLPVYVLFFAAAHNMSSGIALTVLCVNPAVLGSPTNNF